MRMQLGRQEVIKDKDLQKEEIMEQNGQRLLFHNMGRDGRE